MTTSVVCNRRLSTGRRGGQLQLASAPYRQSISCHFLGGMRWLATSTWWTQSSQNGQISSENDKREMEQAQLFETADERGCTPMFGAAHRRGSACIGGSLPSAV